MTVDVRDAVRQLTTGMLVEEKQVKFATRVALTRVAVKSKQAEEREMRDVFDKPTPFTMSGLFVQPATSDSLTAEVKLKDFASKSSTPAAKYMAAQIKGGSRGQKRFERALEAIGALPPGYRVVPGEGAELDDYGNMNRGQIVQILSYFRAFPEAGYKANMTDRRREALQRGSKTRQGVSYFVGRPGDRLPLGIYQRVHFARGTAIRAVMIFVRYVTYQATFDFEYVAKLAIEQHFKGEFQRALAEARASQR
ncbi:hypothetical protein [Pseudoduganella sp. R-43]|uniref:hypothetical protein n=1 Tax=Pseudoduganella sp. R-43 TaxID=3404063 RepID=UPI003CE82DA5